MSEKLRRVVGDPNRRTETWLRSVPNVEEEAGKALSSLVASLGAREPSDELGRVEADKARGKAIADARRAIDALSIDFALRRYGKGYTVREIAEMLETKHPSVIRWRSEVEEWLMANDPDSGFLDPDDYLSDEEKEELPDLVRKWEWVRELLD